MPDPNKPDPIPPVDPQEDAPGKPEAEEFGGGSGPPPPDPTPPPPPKE